MTRNDGAAEVAASQGRQDFRPGHAVHWIQAKKAREDTNEAKRGRIVRMVDDLLTVRIAGQMRCYQIDDPDWVARLVERHGRRVIVQERWSVLRLRTALISVRSRG